MLLLEALDEPVDDPRVDVLAAEEGVARRRDDLEDAVGSDLEDRDVEGAAAEIVHRDHLLHVPAVPIGQRRGGRLVDDRDDVESGDRAGVAGRLPLVVVEVSGDGDDGFADRLTKVVLGDDLHLLEHHRADFGDAVLLVAEDDAHVTVRPLDDAVARGGDGVLHLRRVPLSPDEALRRVHGVLRVRDRLPLGDVSDEAFSSLRHGHHRRRRLVPTTVRDDHRAPVFHDGDARVRGAKVDADYLLHPRLSRRARMHVRRAEGGAAGLMS